MPRTNVQKLTLPSSSPPKRPVKVKRAQPRYVELFWTRTKLHVNRRRPENSILTTNKQ